MNKTDFSQKQDSNNPGQKSLGQYYNIHIFLSFLCSLLKQCILFKIFLQFSLPHPIQSWNSGKILDTRVQHCLWGEGKGWTCVNWKTPQKRKSVPRLLSMIVAKLIQSHLSSSLPKITLWTAKQNFDWLVKTFQKIYWLDYEKSKTTTEPKKRIRDGMGKFNMNVSWMSNTHLHSHSVARLEKQ